MDLESPRWTKSPVLCADRQSPDANQTLAAHVTRRSPDCLVLSARTAAGRDDTYGVNGRIAMRMERLFRLAVHDNVQSRWIGETEDAESKNDGRSVLHENWRG